MRSRVVRVKKIRTPMFDPLGDFSRGAEIPIPCRPDRGHRETDGTCPTEQRRIRGRDDNWFVTCVSLGSRQEVDLALTAPPGLSHVDVQYPQRHRDKVAMGFQGGNAEHRILHPMQPVQNKVVTLRMG